MRSLRMPHARTWHRNLSPSLIRAHYFTRNGGKGQCGGRSKIYLNLQVIRVELILPGSRWFACGRLRPPMRTSLGSVAPEPDPGSRTNPRS